MVDEQPIRNAIAILESWGLRVELGLSVFARNGIFAGTDQQRAADFNQAILDPDIKAIFCSRGGYGLSRIVGLLHLDYLAAHPKWLVGFSDVTVLHSALFNLHTCTIHAVMPNSFSTTHPDSLLTLRKALWGEKQVYAESNNEPNIPGIGRGNLVGGNLSMLYALRGTPYEPDFHGGILFVEDVGEKLYHLDRMMANFMLGGKFDGLQGVVVGGFTDMSDGSTPYGKTAYGIISEYLSDKKIPVAFGLSVGHIHRNLALVMGARVEIEVGASSWDLRFL